MKSKELIRLIQEADPTGEEHCCLHNSDIGSVDVEPAYYDGPLHVIDRDENGHPFRGTRVRVGIKINITSLSISDCLEYDPFEVQYPTEDDRKRYEHIDVANRLETNTIRLEVEREQFENWVFVKLQQVRPVSLGSISRIKEIANKYFDTNRMGPDNPVITVPLKKSYHECREAYWEETIQVRWDDFSRIWISPRVSTSVVS